MGLLRLDGFPLPTKFESNGHNSGRKPVAGSSRKCFRKFFVVPTLWAGMGQLIILAERLADRSRPARSEQPAFFFDVACPFSYLAAERVERILGDVEWIPAPAVGLDGGARWGRFEAMRAP